MNESCFTLGDGEQTSSGRVRMKIRESNPRRDASTSMAKSPAALAIAHGIADPLRVWPPEVASDKSCNFDGSEIFTSRVALTHTTIAREQGCTRVPSLRCNHQRWALCADLDEHSKQRHTPENMRQKTGANSGPTQRLKLTIGSEEHVARWR